MKKSKILLTSVIIFAATASALAFGGKFGQNYCTAPVPIGGCAVTTQCTAEVDGSTVVPGNNVCYKIKTVGTPCTANGQFCKLLGKLSPQ
jgi:hypothetical protein